MKNHTFLYRFAFIVTVFACSCTGQESSTKLLDSTSTKSAATLKAGKITSGFIKYADFDSRRKLFIQNFGELARLGIFPTYFEINRSTFDSLYRHGQDSLHVNSKMAVRMYPVWDERFTTTNLRHSWAFMWADTSDHSSTQFSNDKSLIMDIINPCPPPHDCH